ncbi:MAG: protease family protein [Euryarchaeota archaeon]|nr:protease family protein [Euryarchaeota archaeon]
MVSRGAVEIGFVYISHCPKFGDDIGNTRKCSQANPSFQIMTLEILLTSSLITLLGIYIGALALQNKSIFLASFMHGVVNAQDHGIWTIIYPDYNPLIGGGDGLIALIILLPVALYYLRNTRSCSFL